MPRERSCTHNARGYISCTFSIVLWVLAIIWVLTATGAYPNQCETNHETKCAPSWITSEDDSNAPSVISYTFIMACIFGVYVVTCGFLFVYKEPIFAAKMISLDKLNRILDEMHSSQPNIYVKIRCYHIVGDSSNDTSELNTFKLEEQYDYGSCQDRIPFSPVILSKDFAVVELGVSTCFDSDEASKDFRIYKNNFEEKYKSRDDLYEVSSRVQLDTLSFPITEEPTIFTYRVYKETFPGCILRGVAYFSIVVGLSLPYILLIRRYTEYLQHEIQKRCSVNPNSRRLEVTSDDVTIMSSDVAVPPPNLSQVSVEMSASEYRNIV